MCLVAGVVAFCAWLPAAAFGFPFAFSVRGDVDDQLYRIDLATGTATAIGAAGFSDIESLALHPHTGVLYGVDDFTNQLVTINPITGAATAIGPLNVALSDMGLAFDGAGSLFMSVDAPQNAFRLNPVTGAATLLGAQGQQVTGLTWRNGVLFGLGGDNTDNLVTVNTATGQATAIGSLGTVTASDGGLDFDGNGVLWGIEDTGTIFRIDPLTGAATPVATTLNGFESLHVIKPVPVVTGAGAGGGPHVIARVDTDGDGSVETTTASFFADVSAFSGGVRVARCDVNADGVADIVTGAGPGGAHVRVVNGLTGAEILVFFAYDPGFTGGVFVACGDVTQDGKADIITGAGAGGGPHVRVFDGATGTPLPGPVGSFHAYDPAFAGGVQVASCDVNGDTVADIITGAGAGGGPHVRVFDGATGTPLPGPVGSFHAYDPAFAGGVFVGCGNLNGDRFADVITGAGAGGGPHVRVFDGATGTPLPGPVGSFHAYDPAFAGGVTVAAGDVNGDGIVDIITGAGAGGGPHVRVFHAVTLAELEGFLAYLPAFPGGVFVAGGVGF